MDIIDIEFLRLELDCFRLKHYKRSQDYEGVEYSAKRVFAIIEKFSIKDLLLIYQNNKNRIEEIIEIYKKNPKLKELKNIHNLFTSTEFRKLANLT